MPIYLVKTPTEKKLIEAATKAQAINHVTRTTISADTVTASEVVALMQAGTQVEKATAESPLMQEPVARQETAGSAVTVAKITAE